MNKAQTAEILEEIQASVEAMSKEEVQAAAGGKIGEGVEEETRTTARLIMQMIALLGGNPASVVHNVVFAMLALTIHRTGKELDKMATGLETASEIFRDKRKEGPGSA